MAWIKVPVFLSAIIFSTICTLAQDRSFKPFYVELHIAPLLNFGTNAEIKGGYDSISYDEKEHLIPAFKSTTATELVFGYGTKKWEFQSTISYFRQDITLVKTVDRSTNGPKLASANFISARISALFLLSNIKWWPYGLYSGFFIGTISSISYAVDPGAKAEYGIQDISNQTQFSWGFDSHLIFALGKKGFFGTVGLSLTMPGAIGSVGKIQMGPSDYTIVNDSIVMYTMKIYVGVGLRIGKQKSMTL